MSEWKNIETAPKDGTSILVALHEWNDPANRYVFEVVSWQDGCWSSEAYPIYPPTHWMHITDPPSTAEEIKRKQEETILKLRNEGIAL
jgi:hypothetical protein